MPGGWLQGLRESLGGVTQGQTLLLGVLLTDREGGNQDARSCDNEDKKAEDENQGVLHRLRLPHRDMEEGTEADDGRDPDTDEHPSILIYRHPDAEPERDRKKEREKRSEQNEQIAFGEHDNHLSAQR